MDKCTNDSTSSREVDTGAPKDMWGSIDVTLLLTCPCTKNDNWEEVMSVLTHGTKK
jgi:hypothetical protein